VRDRRHRAADVRARHLDLGRERLARHDHRQSYRASNTAILFTYDEGEADERVPFVAIAPSVPPGTVTDQPFNHYALLRTTQEMLGVGPFLQNAATAPSMRAALHL
jgi:hypothetical protein